MVSSAPIALVQFPCRPWLSSLSLDTRHQGNGGRLCRWPAVESRKQRRLLAGESMSARPGSGDHGRGSGGTPHSLRLQHIQKADEGLSKPIVRIDRIPTRAQRLLANGNPSTRPIHPLPEGKQISGFRPVNGKEPQAPQGAGQSSQPRVTPISAPIGRWRDDGVVCGSRTSQFHQHSHSDKYAALDTYCARMGGHNHSFMRLDLTNQRTNKSFDLPVRSR